MDNKKSYVYKITCKITGEYYFGSSFYVKSDSYWGKGRKIKERIAKYGKENFFKEILEEFDDRTEAHRVENEYIEQFINDDKCLNKRLDYHFEIYGEESRIKNSAAKRGQHHTDETRTKISDALCGKHFSTEHRAKISAAKCGENHHNFGKHLSEEHRAKLSAALKGLMSGEKSAWYGKHFSTEHRAKISAAQRGKPHPHGKHWRKNPVTGKREYYD